MKKQAEHLCKNAALLSPSEAWKVGSPPISASHCRAMLSFMFGRSPPFHRCTLVRLCECVIARSTLCLQVGLVDEVVSSEQLMPAAEAAMIKALKQPDSGRIVVKERFRGETFSREWEAVPKGRGGRAPGRCWAATPHHQGSGGYAAAALGQEGQGEAVSSLGSALVRM